MENTEIMRAIVELSSMINNDEVYIHYTNEESLNNIIEKLKGPFREPRVRCRRFVTKEEIRDGLDPARNYTTQQVYDEPNIFPELTCALDALTKLYQELSFHSNVLETNIQDALIHSVSYSYYDCMSGGASGYYLAMCRYLMETHGVDLDSDVYPGKGEEKWYTVRDFFESIKDIPRYEKKIGTHNVKGLLIESHNV